MTDANETRLILAGAACDAAGAFWRPAAIRIRGREIVEAGPAAPIRPATGESVVRAPDRLILPGLVNAHAHLDLTHIGPMPFDRGFTDWVDIIREKRSTEFAQIRAVVRAGAELALRGGTVAIGDIAGVMSLAASNALEEGPLLGVSYVEFFGIGARQERAIERLRATAEEADRFHRIRLGLQPHAPYSAGPELYQAAAILGRERGLPLATHLAETREEIEFTTLGTGPQTDLLRRLGVWDDSIRPSGRHPIEHLAGPLAEADWLVAHVNYADPAHLDLLAERATTIAYCPRASEYFGHKDHPYQEMRRRGIRVALGTDSIVCLDTPDRISVLDEMRLLFQRDGANPGELLAMATTNGATALRLDERLVTLTPGPVAGLIALRFDPDDPTDPLEQVLKAEERGEIEWALPPCG